MHNSVFIANIFLCVHTCVCLCMYVCVYAYVCVVTGIRGPFRASEPPTSENPGLPSKFLSEQKAHALKCSDQLGYLQFLSNP